MYKETAKELLEFIEKSPSCFHAVKTMKDMLDMERFEEIKEADVVILAIDIAVTGTERFEGKPTIKVPTNVCVKAPKKLIEKIENELGK